MMRRESGLTMVEVIVAAMLALVAVVLIAHAMTSSTSTITKTRAVKLQAEVARHALQLLAADQTWGRTRADCAASMNTGVPCDVTSLVAGAPFTTQRVGGAKGTFAVSAKAIGVDSPADLVGPQDRDRRTPDWYAITVTVNAPKGMEGVKELVLTETTDSLSRTAGGVLVVRACAATNHVDERVELGVCDRARSEPMAPPTTVGAIGDLDAHAYSAAPEWARSIQLQPVTVACSASGPGGAVVPLATGADGSWTSSGALQPGRWTIACSTPSGFDPWLTKTTRGGAVRIDEGRRVEAMFAFQPAKVDVEIRQATIHFWRYRKRIMGVETGDLFVTKMRGRLEQYKGAPLNVDAQLVPAPYGRAPLAAPAPPSATGLRLSGITPGLYSGALLSGDDQYYLYTAGPSQDRSLPYNFAAPIDWLYVHLDGRLEMSPKTDPGGLWQVRWWCHSGETPVQLACPDGQTPSGRGVLYLGGAGGRGGT